MSYLFLIEEIGILTNLIPLEDTKVIDIYSCLLDELKPYLINKLIDHNKKEIILSIIDRKLIKAIFMPLIYAETITSITMIL